MRELFDIRDKVALVTGGAQGLGRMIAEGLVRAGAAVTITSRKAELGKRAAAEMAAYGRCVAIASDLGTPEAILQLAQEFSSDHAALHILINNAGRTWGAPLEQFPDRAWSDIMALNVQAPFALVRELLPLLKAGGAPHDPARVLNLGSLAGRAVEKLNAYSYAASKAALHHLTRVLAADLAAHRITVNTLIPGYFPTRMTAHIRADEEQLQALEARIPLGRLGCAEDIVGLSIFLSSRASAYITGSEIVVDGGLIGCR